MHHKIAWSFGYVWWACRLPQVALGKYTSVYLHLGSHVWYSEPILGCYVWYTNRLSEAGKPTPGCYVWYTNRLPEASGITPFRADNLWYSEPTPGCYVCYTNPLLEDGGITPFRADNLWYSELTPGCYVWYTNRLWHYSIQSRQPMVFRADSRLLHMVYKPTLGSWWHYPIRSRLQVVTYVIRQMVALPLLEPTSGMLFGSWWHYPI